MICCTISHLLKASKMTSKETHIFYFLVVVSDQSESIVDIISSSFFPPIFVCSFCVMIKPKTVQRFRATLHQLHQWEVAAVLQPPHVRTWARRVQTWGYRMDLYRFRYGFASLHRAHWKGIYINHLNKVFIFFFLSIYLEWFFWGFLFFSLYTFVFTQIVFSHQKIIWLIFTLFILYLNNDFLRIFLYFSFLFYLFVYKSHFAIKW